MKRRTFLAGLTAAAATPLMPRFSLAKAADGFFELRAQSTPRRLAGTPYAASDLWLYNGETPGPEIRVTQGDKVQVRFINDLPEPTSIHWHGIRIENAMDGVSGLTQEPVLPGGSFDYEFTVPDAGTFWYHAHNKSWAHVARGLYGSLIVEEPVLTFEREHDLTLVIDDWRLGQDGVLHQASMGAFMDWSHAGRLGNFMTVNGTSEPRFKMNTGEPYRVRLINAANARIFQIDPSAMGAKVMGFDGFVFDEPRDERGVLFLAPAQRIDLLVQSAKARSVPLNNIEELGLQRMSGAEPKALAIFDFQGPKKTPTAAPKLSPNQVTKPNLTNARTIPLVMTSGAMGRAGTIIYQGKPLTRETMLESQQLWAFNGTANMTDHPMFSSRRGETVIVKTVNQTGWPHAMHVHGHHFQIISRNGKQVQNRDWRDTFFIDGNETVEIAFVADNPGKWMLHCHMLEHAAAGMRTWFEVG